MPGKNNMSMVPRGPSSTRSRNVFHNDFDRVLAHARVIDNIVERHTEIIQVHSAAVETLATNVDKVNASVGGIVDAIRSQDARVGNLENRMNQLEERVTDVENTSVSIATQGRKRNSEAIVNELSKHFDLTSYGRFVCPFCGRDYDKNYITQHAGKWDCKQTRRKTITKRKKVSSISSQEGYLEVDVITIPDGDGTGIQQ